MKSYLYNIGDEKVKKIMEKGDRKAWKGHNSLRRRMRKANEIFPTSVPPPTSREKDNLPPEHPEEKKARTVKVK